MSDDSELQLKRLPRFKPRGGLEVMYASIRALFLRELQTRFGHYRLGYVWAFLEPALNVIFMLVFFGAIIKRVLPGIDYPVFLINGILPFFVFRKSCMQALGAIDSNKGLLSYKNVRPIDIVISRTLLELMLYFICYIILSLCLIWLGFTISFSQIPNLLLLWLMLFLLVFSIAGVFLVIGSFSKDIAKFITPLFFIMYFLSGALFPLHRVPEEYLPYIMWNPFAHLFELMRNCVAPTYSVLEGASYWYIAYCMVWLVFLCLIFLKIFHKGMLKTK